MHTLKRDVNTMIEVTIGEDQLELMIMTKKEAGSLDRTRSIDRIVLEVDFSLLDRFSKIVYS